MNDVQNTFGRSVMTLVISQPMTAKSRFAELLIGGLLLMLALGGFVM